MSEAALTNALLVVLVLCCGSLLYLDWRRQGELELLHLRVDGLERGRRGSAAPPPQPATAATAAAAVERVLHADTDLTLEQIARDAT